MRGDISHRGRRGNTLPGEKEDSWKVDIMKKEVARRRKEQAKASTDKRTCCTCAHVGYRQGKYVEEEYCTLTGVKCGRGKENCLGWKERQ